MTKKFNKGSKNQNSPQTGNAEAEFANEFMSGDNSKGSKRNKKKQNKTNPPIKKRRRHFLTEIEVDS